MRPSRLVVSVVMLTSLSACRGEGAGDRIGVRKSLLTAEERRDRAAQIRASAEARGLNNGLLLAGIASAETGMAHCWSEATWACQGPASVDCGGGPVIAGAADGPCAAQQGGLGMFQFDAGTYDDTLTREGDRILSLDGNVEAAIDFVAAMVVRSTYIDGVDDDDAALAWMNEVRPWNETWTAWIQTVTHYYNGCVPGRCGVYDERFASYDDHGTSVLNEMGAEFWYGRPPGCGPIAPEGAILDETDECFGAGGPVQFWRTETNAGYDGSLLWTHATDSAEVANQAFYRLLFSEPGRYELQAYVDRAIATSQQTAYEVQAGGRSTVVVVDQSQSNGFRSLGTFDFAADEDEWLRVPDVSGEPRAEERVIVVDAIRVVPEGSASPPGSGPGPTPPLPEPVNPEIPETPSGARGDLTEGEGCNINGSVGAGSRGANHHHGLLAGLWLAALRRCRRKRTRTKACSHPSYV